MTHEHEYAMNQTRQHLTLPLGKIIEEFVERKGWTVWPEWINEVKYSRLETNITVSGQTFRLYIDGIEEHMLLSMHVYFPFKVPDSKYVDAALLFNYMNNRFQYYGRVSADEEGVIQYKDFTDAFETEPDVAMIENMLHSAVTMLENHLNTFASVILAGKSFEQIRQELEHKYFGSENNA